MRLNLLQSIGGCVLVCAFASHCWAQPNMPGWTEFHSSAGPKLMSYRTSDWENFNRVSVRFPPFSFRHPASWKFNGYSVFDLPNGYKIAELSPGVVELTAGQECPSGRSSTAEKLFFEKSIALDSYHGQKALESFIINSTGNTWYWYRYCISDGSLAFLMAFFVPRPSPKSEKIFDKVISTLAFDRKVEK